MKELQRYSLKITKIKSEMGGIFHTSKPVLRERSNGVVYKCSDVDPHIKFLQDDATSERQLKMKGLSRIELLEDHNKRLLETVKLCHRKHCQHDDSIGWDELASDMGFTLAEVMGDDKFQGWLESEE